MPWGSVTYGDFHGFVTKMEEVTSAFTNSVVKANEHVCFYFFVKYYSVCRSFPNSVCVMPDVHWTACVLSGADHGSVLWTRSTHSVVVCTSPQRLELHSTQ